MYLYSHIIMYMIDLVFEKPTAASWLILFTFYKPGSTHHDVIIHLPVTFSDILRINTVATYTMQSSVLILMCITHVCIHVMPNCNANKCSERQVDVLPSKNQALRDIIYNALYQLMGMSREWILITKEHIATHTNLIVLFKSPSLYSSTFVI